MGFRFRKSIKIGKHFRVNLSKSGIGYSIGGKGYRHTVSSNGKSKDTFSIPGTGISYTTSSGKTRPHSTNSTSQHISTSARHEMTESERKNTNKLLCILLISIALILFGFPIFFVLISTWENKIPPAPETTFQTTVTEEKVGICFKDDGTQLLPVGETAELTLIIVDDKIDAKDIILSGEDEQIIDIIADTSADGIIVYQIVAKSPGIVNLSAETSNGQFSTTIAQIIVEEPYVDTYQQNQFTSSSSSMYVLNTATKKIHFGGCSYSPEVGSENRDVVTDISGLLANGYTWCEYCQ